MSRITSYARGGVRVFIALALLLMAGRSYAAPIMYGGVGNGSAINPGSLLQVNQTVGTGTFIGDPVTPGGLSGIAFDAAGTLYGSVVGISFGASNLVTIDHNTGGLLTTTAILDGLGSTVGISDLAVQPGTNIIFGSQQGFASGLYTITPGGTATLIGTTGIGGFSGIAFDAAGTLYGTSATAGNGQLVTLNPATAAILTTVITSGVQPEIDGLAVRPTDGTIFGTRPGFFGGDLILTVNPLTGLTTAVGSTGQGTVVDLAFMNVVIPEPSSLVLFALGTVGLVFMDGRRRKRKMAA